MNTRPLSSARIRIQSAFTSSQIELPLACNRHIDIAIDPLPLLKCHPMLTSRDPSMVPNHTEEQRHRSRMRRWLPLVGFMTASSECCALRPFSKCLMHVVLGCAAMARYGLGWRCEDDLLLFGCLHEMEHCTHFGGGTNVFCRVSDGVMALLVRHLAR